MGERLLYQALCRVEYLEQQGWLTQNLRIHHLARRGSSSHASTPVVKEGEEEHADVQEYTSDSNKPGKIPRYPPCAMRRLRSVTGTQRTTSVRARVGQTESTSSRSMLDKSPRPYYIFFSTLLR